MHVEADVALAKLELRSFFSCCGWDAQVRAQQPCRSAQQSESQPVQQEIRRDSWTSRRLALIGLGGAAVAPLTGEQAAHKMNCGWLRLAEWRAPAKDMATAIFRQATPG